MLIVGPKKGRIFTLGQKVFSVGLIEVERAIVLRTIDSDTGIPVMDGLLISIDKNTGVVSLISGINPDICLEMDAARKLLVR